jgi:hypothetical protein
VPTYVFYDGRLIEKRYRPSKPQHAASTLPAPAVQSFEAYASPIDDRPITSHRQRERDLHQSDSYDRRDSPAAFRKARDVRYQQQRRQPAATEP